MKNIMYACQLDVWGVSRGFLGGVWNLECPSFTLYYHGAKYVSGGVLLVYVGCLEDV